MKLTVKNTIVHENITDEKGNIIGQLEFDPTDVTIYKQFLNLIDTVEEKIKADKELGEIGDIPNVDFTNVEDFEKYREEFNKIGKRLDNYLKVEKDIKQMTNEVFGNVSDAFDKVSKSLDPYIQLIEWATPYFKSGREEKLSKYLDADKEEEKDVL